MGPSADLLADRLDLWLGSTVPLAAGLVAHLRDDVIGSRRSLARRRHLAMALKIRAI
jgi:hypothetical protein